MKKYREIGQYLVVDPNVCFGKLTFKGTRLPVEGILDLLASGKTIDDVRRDWPQLSRRAIEEAIRFASAALVEVTGAATSYEKGVKPGPPWRKRAAGKRSGKNGAHVVKSAS